MAQATRATKMLENAGMAFRLCAYEYDPSVDSIGLAAAAAIGADPGQVFKTLMVLADGKPACVIAPSSGEVSMKKAAAALGAKSAAMMKPVDAERLSGYKVGGISPFGQLRPQRTALEQDAMVHDLVYMNGGQRGLQVRLSPKDAVTVLKAIVTPLLA